MIRRPHFIPTALLALLVLPAISLAGDGPSFAEFDRKARARERLTIVFHGASLTWGANATDPMLTSYRAVMAERFEKLYPTARFKFFDSAIGGTGSQLGLFRLDRDVLARKPDLVFVDFTANDGITSTNPNSLASYEAIVRRILTEAKVPVVQVLFPFEWDVAKGNTSGMHRLEAHHAIGKAYNTAVGDAVTLAQQRVKDGTPIKSLWPHDGVHPGNAGYVLFADAAWNAYEHAVKSKQICVIPDKMLSDATYMKSARVRISSLAPLPAGWKTGSPHLTSAFFDMLMSRWLDDLAIATGKSDTKVERLRVNFTGSMVMLFGESTTKSAKYRVYIDGKLVERKSNDGKTTIKDFDAGDLANKVNGTCHHAQVLIESLDATVEHTLEIEPIFAGDKEQELRFESICVAGGTAQVRAFVGTAR